MKNQGYYIKKVKQKENCKRKKTPRETKKRKPKT